MGRQRTGLAHRRRAVGLSQDALADRLGVDRTTVSRWERGATEPQLTLRCRLANVLDITLDDLNVLLVTDRAAGPRSAGEPPPAPRPPPPAAGLPSLPHLSADPPSTAAHADHELIGDAVEGLRAALTMAKDAVQRRALLRLAATLGVLGTSPTLLGRIADQGLDGPVDAELVTALEAVTAGYAALAMHAPPGECLGPAGTHEARLRSTLERSTSPTQRRRLLRTAGETAALVGWFANSTGRDRAADDSYERARVFAREADDRLLEANICGLQASLHSRIVRGDIAHSERSARLLDIALALAPQSSHRTRRWLAATRAFEHAASGAAERFTELTAAAAAEPDGEPPSDPGFFTVSAFFASWSVEFVGKYRGLGLIALDRPAGAVVALREALQAVGEDVSRGTLLADLTAACAAAGDIEQACAYAHEALDLTGGRRPRTLQRLRGARRHFLRVAHQAIDELDERLRLAGVALAG